MLAIVNASDEDFNKLTKAINNSEGATKEMADIMNNNLNGATTIMKSNMESLGLAIYEKFKGPATKGIKSVTENLEKLTKETSNGKLSNSLDKIASSFGKLIEKGANLMSKVLPKMIDGLAWILDHGKTIAKVVGTITGAIAIFKTTANISKVVQGFQKAQVALSLFTLQTKGATIAQGVLNGTLTLGETVVALLTGKITLATVAQKLWNMAMAANPIGLVTLAVAGLAAGLVYLATRQTEAQKQTKEFADEMRNAEKAYNECNQSIDDTTNANLAQINSVSKLKDELKTLVDENGNVKKGYEARVDFILNELNGALKTEYKITGEIIENYQDLKQEIDGLIEKKRAQIILQGKEEKYNEAIEEEIKATKELREAEKKLGMTYAEAQEKYYDYFRARFNKDLGKELTQKELDILKEYSNGKFDVLDNIVAGYNSVEDRIKESLENQKDYEQNYEFFVKKEYDKINNSIIGTTENWTNKTTQYIKDAIIEQSKDLESYKALYERTESKVAEQNMEQAQKNLADLATELVARRNTLETLGQEEIEAWKAIRSERAHV